MRALFFLLIITAFCSCDTQKSARQKMIEYRLPEEFSFRVSKKFRDSQNHNDPTLLYGIKGALIVPEVFFNKIEVGDSLVKNSNELVITILKANGEVLELDYNDVF